MAISAPRISRSWRLRGIQLDDVDGVAIFAMQQNLAVDDFSWRRLDQTHDRAKGDALSASAFTDNTQGFLAINRDIHPVNCFNNSPFEEEVGLEISQFEDGVVRVVIAFRSHS